MAVPVPVEPPVRPLSAEILHEVPPVRVALVIKSPPLEIPPAARAIAEALPVRAPPVDARVVDAPPVVALVALDAEVSSLVLVPPLAFVASPSEFCLLGLRRAKIRWCTQARKRREVAG